MLRARLPFARVAAALALAVCTFAPVAVAQQSVSAESQAAALSPELRADIERLMRASGASEIGLQMSNLMAAQMAGQLQQQNPELPERVLEIVVDVVGSRMGGMAGSLHERLIPVYAKHFSHDEIKQLVAFYATPLGSKMLETMPQLMQDSIREGEGWAREIMPGIQSELESRFRAEGILGSQSGADPAAADRPAPNEAARPQAE